MAKEAEDDFDSEFTFMKFGMKPLRRQVVLGAIDNRLLLQNSLVEDIA
jgi:hypothetical protein